MTQTTETGYKSTLAKPLSASDTSMFVATAPTITKGRIRIYSGNRQEWVSFTGVSGTELTGLTRGLSQTAVPATGGTGQSWIGGTKIEIVSMHDQLADKQEDNDFNGTITTDSIRFDGTTTSGLRLKSLTTTQRDALTPADGDKIYNSTTGTEQTYHSGTWNDAGTSTTPNASETVAGKVEIATDAELAAGTSTGGTGALLGLTVDNTSTSLTANKVLVMDGSGNLPQATESLRGAAEIATTAESLALSNDTNIITPSKLGEVIHHTGTLQTQGGASTVSTSWTFTPTYSVVAYIELSATNTFTYNQSFFEEYNGTSYDIIATVTATDTKNFVIFLKGGTQYRLRRYVDEGRDGYAYARYVA